MRCIEGKYDVAEKEIFALKFGLNEANLGKR